MPDHDMAEDRYIRSMLDLYGARMDDTLHLMATDVDRLRDSWGQSYAQEREASAARVAAIKQDTKTWLAARAAADGQAPKNVAADGRGWWKLLPSWAPPR